MNFETVIGIEIHCELKTKSKMFSAAPNRFGDRPNRNVSKVDMGFPGIMPTLNKQAVVYAIMAATALHMEIDHEIWFDRKNYFYPDLPKGYQITQDKRPIGRNGYVEIETPQGVKHIRIQRLHMEEDTAKQLHFQDHTLLDYNRCGVPLIEIVTHPDIHSAEEAAAYVESLRSLLLYTGVSDVKMEEGSMRCDINVSIRPYGVKELGTKTEIKNLNSINNVLLAVAFEVERQTRLLLRGGVVEQETRRFDEATKQTVLMRKKTDAVDYKYFCEPNIYPISLSDEWIQSIQASVPELPDARKKRYQEVLGLSSYDASVLIVEKQVSDYYDAVLQTTKEAKLAANWMMSDVMAYRNKTLCEMSEFPITPKQLGELINLIASGSINSKQAKKVFEIMLQERKDPGEIAKAQGMMQVSDQSVILGWINTVLDSNAQAIETYQSGRQNILGFLVGQVIKLSKGQANPALVSELIREELAKR